MLLSSALKQGWLHLQGEKMLETVDDIFNTKQEQLSVLDSEIPGSH